MDMAAQSHAPAWTVRRSRLPLTIHPKLELISLPLDFSHRHDSPRWTLIPGDLECLVPPYFEFPRLMGPLERACFCLSSDVGEEVHSRIVAYEARFASAGECLIIAQNGPNVELGGGNVTDSNHSISRLICSIAVVWISCMQI